MNRWSKKQILKIRVILVLLYLVFLIVVFLVSLAELKLSSLLQIKINPWLQLFGLLVAGSPVLWFFSHRNPEFSEILSEINKHTLGGKGEKEVYQRLTKLGPEFCILKNLNPGKKTGRKTGDVDIVVISHKGIVAVEVKTITNFVALRYYRERNIRKARHKAGQINYLIKQVLGVNRFVIPMLVIAGNYRHQQEKSVEIEGIATTIVGSWHVNNAILGQTGHSLSTPEIKRITDALSPYSQ